MTEIAPEEVGRVAKGLTKAQRDWLKRGWRKDGRGYWPLRHAMLAKGLIDGNENTTPLSIAVRTYLSTQERNG